MEGKMDEDLTLAEITVDVIEGRLVPLAHSGYLQEEEAAMILEDLVELRVLIDSLEDKIKTAMGDKRASHDAPSKTGDK